MVDCQDLSNALLCNRAGNFLAKACFSKVLPLVTLSSPRTRAEAVGCSRRLMPERQSRDRSIKSWFQ